MPVSTESSCLKFLVSIFRSHPFHQMQRRWEKLCGNPFSGWEKKKMPLRTPQGWKTKARTTLIPSEEQLKVWNQWFPAETAAEAQLVLWVWSSCHKTQPASQQVPSASVAVGSSVDGAGTSPKLSSSPPAFCFGWWKCDCSQLSAWYKPTPVYLLRSAFQCVIGSSLAST